MSNVLHEVVETLQIKVRVNWMGTYNLVFCLTHVNCYSFELMNDIDIYEKPKLNKMLNFAIECLGRLYTFGVHNFSVHLFYYNPLSKKCFRGGIYTLYTYTTVL